MTKPITRVFLVRGSTAANNAYLGQAGEITIDKDKDTLVVHDGVKSGGHPLAKASDFDITKGITLSEVVPGEDISIFFTDRAYTVAYIAAVVRGSGAMVNWTLRYGADRTAVGTELIVSGSVTTSQAGQMLTGFNNSGVPASNWLWFETYDQSGTLEEFHLTAYLRRT